MKGGQETCFRFRRRPGGGEGEEWATRRKYIIVVNKTCSCYTFLDRLPNWQRNINAVCFIWIAKVPWKRKAKNDFPCYISVCSQLFLAGMNNRTFIYRIIELQLIATCDRRQAGGVGEYLESFSLMRVCVCVSVGYICVIYARKKMALHQVMAASFPSFCALNKVHSKLDI